MAVETLQSAEVAVPAVEPAIPSPAEPLGQRVKLAIKQVGTAQLVAERSGIPKATLSGYSSGRHMSFENAIALAKATGVTLEWLATGQGPMKPGEPEKPQETPPQRPLSLWRDTHMDTLITAYATAIQTIIAAGRDETNAPGVMRLTAILYDQLMGLDGK